MTSTVGIVAASVSASKPTAGCDAELRADGALMRQLPAVVMENARRRSARAAARRGSALHRDRDAEPAEHHER